MYLIETKFLLDINYVHSRISKYEKVIVRNTEIDFFFLNVSFRSLSIYFQLTHSFPLPLNSTILDCH